MQLLGPKQVVCQACGKIILEADELKHLDEHFKTIPDNYQVELVSLPKNEDQLTRGKCKGKGGEKTCRICYLDFVEDDPLIFLACTHFYHQDCILNWIKKKPTCPIDNKPIFKT